MHFLDLFTTSWLFYWTFYAIWIPLIGYVDTLRLGAFTNGLLKPHTIWTSMIRIYQFSEAHCNLVALHIMALCINCNIAMRTDQQQYDYQVVDMSPNLVSIIEEWIDREVSDGDRVCHECVNLLMTELDNRNEGVIGGRQLGHREVCVCCGISISRRTGRRSHLLLGAERVQVANMINPRQIGADDARICNSCWQRAHQQVLQNRDADVDVLQSRSSSLTEQPSAPSSELVSAQSSENDDPDTRNVSTNVYLEGYSRTSDTSGHCFVPECTNNERHRVPLYLKRKILKEHKLFVTANARVCGEHRILYNWDLLAEYEFITEFTEQQIVQMLDLLRKETTTVLDFENVEEMPDHVCHFWTGKTVLQFLTIMTLINQLGDMVRKPRTALALYLVKMRSGEPFVRLASLFSKSKTLVCMYIKKARQCLISTYVPLHLGVHHMPRADMSLRNLLIPQGLFGTEERNPIVICDGTYIYLQKSSNYLFQKKSYSLHKYTNLVKPFLLVATDGHILDVFGPYAATTSDADIMKQLFQSPQMPLRNYFRQNDIFILDRGFRDAINLLTSLGYIVYKPESLGEGETQLSTLNANKSRLVTLVRWVIEVVNGRFKRDFKIFRNRYFNVASTHLMTDFRIAAAMINHFHPTITDRLDAQSILDRALARLHMPNYLADHVIRHNLNRHRVSFVPINGDIPELPFPEMEMSDLILFALGTYQIKQARSYYGEHIRSHGSFIVELSNNIDVTNVLGIENQFDETMLVRGRIRSRHQSNKIYYVYILLNVTQAGNWQDRICGYYCSCIVGKRTVGSCAHVMTIVWYLGWARHQDNISAPANFLDNILIREDIENEEDD